MIFISLNRKGWPEGIICWSQTAKRETEISAVAILFRDSLEEMGILLESL